MSTKMMNMDHEHDHSDSAQASRHRSHSFDDPHKRASLRRYTTWAPIKKRASDNDAICTICFSSAARAATEELSAFALAHPPLWQVDHPTLGGVAFILQTMLRPLVHVVPHRLLTCTMGAFWGESSRCGGIASINVLLMASASCTDVARFEKHASKYLEETNSMFNNLAVVASLIINCTHLGAIGRPRPWEEAPEVRAALGDGPTDALMWAAYACNVATETLAVILLSHCIFWRLAIGAHNTAMQKIILIHENRVVDNVNRLAIFVISLLLVVITLGGIVAHASYGFAAAVALLALPFGIVSVGVSLFKTLLELHDQARDAAASHGVHGDSHAHAPCPAHGHVHGHVSPRPGVHPRPHSPHGHAHPHDLNV